MANASEPASKRRRLEEPLTSRPATANGVASQTQTTSSNGSSVQGTSITILDPTVLLEIKEISVVVPQRKKYTLCFTPTHLYARLPDSKDPAPGISYAWNDIGAFLSQRSYSYGMEGGHHGKGHQLTFSK